MRSKSLVWLMSMKADILLPTDFDNRGCKYHQLLYRYPAFRLPLVRQGNQLNFHSWYIEWTQFFSTLANYSMETPSYLFVNRNHVKEAPSAFIYFLDSYRTRWHRDCRCNWWELHTIFNVEKTGISRLTLPTWKWRYRHRNGKFKPR